jgi:hypothetical protein
MFNSAVIDVAIVMVLSFLAVSLAASAITEAFSSILKWRENYLEKGFKALLNFDPAKHPLALELYNHALISPLTSGTAKSFETMEHKPAYINSEQFAVAFYNTLGGGSPTDVIGKIQDPQLKAAIEALWATSSNDVNKFKKNIAIWFDNSMDRLSGWYKRWTQLVSFSVALVIAVFFNVNVLYESAQIWTRPGIIADLQTSHYKDDLANLLRKTNPKTDPTAADASKKGPAAEEDALKIFNVLEPAFLIGWVEGPEPHDRRSWYMAIASWLLVAGATLFGASFWFDILQRVTHLKGTGLKPERSATPPSPDA